MTYAPFDLDPDTRPCFGLIVLQADETIEDDFRSMFPAEVVRLHINRIPSGVDLTPETLRAMEAALPDAASLMPRGAALQAVGYGCTSGSTLIGPDRVADLVKGACSVADVTNPLSAAMAAIKALGITRLGLVSPYRADIAETMRATFERAGVHVADTLSFGETVEANVARIALPSIEAAARALAARAEVDGLFLSCTNLRSLPVIEPLEADLGLPVLSSNQTLAWHMARGSGVEPRGIGRLGMV